MAVRSPTNNGWEEADESRAERRRGASSSSSTSSSAMAAPLHVLRFVAVVVVLLAAASSTAPAAARRHVTPGGTGVQTSTYMAPTCRQHTASLTDFGGVGDGTTSNTAAFRSAVDHLSQYSGEGGGGAMLYVPAGRWLTAPFNLTSHFTLFLHADAVILATQDITQWPVIDPLPSYGRGRDKAGGRYTSLIAGTNLTDVVITGENGTIDGQGASWWSKFHGNKLKYTRGYLIELMHSDTIFISNVTLLNSPAWNIHPVYSRDVVVSGVTILAPTRSPNTDGINPDSCSQVRIEDCYVVSGDDCVAIKSGWDEYGIAYGMPSEHIVVRRLTCVSPTSAVIALGSEMSGGIRDVRVEDITAVGTESGVRIKTAVGRGAYVRDVYARRMTLTTMKYVFWMTGSYKSHPDDGYDPAAVPVVENISYQDVSATGVWKEAARLEGIDGAPFKGICMANVTAELAKPRKAPWNCDAVEGVSANVTPPPCAPLQGAHDGACPFPEDTLAIDKVAVQQCSYPVPAPAAA